MTIDVTAVVTEENDEIEDVIENENETDDMTIDAVQIETDDMMIVVRVVHAASEIENQ